MSRERVTDAYIDTHLSKHPRIAKLIRAQRSVIESQITEIERLKEFERLYLESRDQISAKDNKISLLQNIVRSQERLHKVFLQFKPPLPQPPKEESTNDQAKE